ncbi:MAG: DUF4270 domain-containing protein, partial [Bacteroidales bacterium]|nr:DUF4270 domain-containing protein [Bacteroidales bacterium]
LTLQTVVFDLPISSRLSDSLPSNNFFFQGQPYNMLFGSCFDPVFGLVEVGSVFQFAPYLPYESGHSYTYGEDPRPVSLTLYVIRSAPPTVLDKTQAFIPQNLYVHEILSDMSYTDAYNNSLLPEHWNPVPVSRQGQIYFGTDTATVALSLDYARELLQANQAERDSTHVFVKRYKGLYLRTEEATSPYGGRLNKGDLMYSRLTLRYTVDGADSTLHYYPYYYGHNAISHSGSNLDPHPAENIYFQGLAGPKPYIDFAALMGRIQDWAQQQQIDLKRLLITNAEVTLSYNPSIDYEIIDQYPTSLALCTRVRADTLAYYQLIGDSYFEFAGGIINRSKFRYTFNITNYLQSLLKKNQVTEADNTWLMEVDAVEDMYSGRNLFVNNYSYPRAVFEGTATDAKPVIKITYTVLK